MSFSLLYSYVPVVLAWYIAGFTVWSPPLALGGAAVGFYMNRSHPLAAKLCGALLAAVAGAAVAQSWHYCALLNPGVDLLALLGGIAGQLARPAVSAVTIGGADNIAVAVVFYAPLVLGLLLCLAASHYEEALAGAFSQLRERRSDRREARAERRVLVPVAERPAVPAMADAPAGVPVIQATAGEPIALPAGLMIDGEARPGFIVIQVSAPAAPALVVRPGYGRGYVVGTCIAAYYLAATASRLWLPLLALGLWCFGPALLAYEEHQLAAMLNSAARALKPW